MDVSKMKPGDHYYMAYVGPPTQYDYVGAMQFRLLCTLGLRAHHSLLDFGCGSLRAGRLFISYLDEGKYYGVEPNKWLIDDAIRNQVGNDLIQLKKPKFDYNDDFSINFNLKFDFIIAQSIFSHAGSDLIRIALPNLRDSLKDDGLIAVTFIQGCKDSREKGWKYPECVQYQPHTINRFAQEADLFIRQIPWYNPRQTWYILAKCRSRLPTGSMNPYLSGAVLFDPEFSNSWESKGKLVRRVRKFASNTLPPIIKIKLKQMLGKD